MNCINIYLAKNCIRYLKIQMLVHGLFLGIGRLLIHSNLCKFTFVSNIKLHSWDESDKKIIFLIVLFLFTVDGVEYAFGAHEFSTSGVFEIEPRQCPGFKFRKSIFMGTTYMDPIQVREFMECQSANYYGNTYHLIVKNCNHFCEDICYKLTGNRIPKWVNRLAKIGTYFNALPWCTLLFTCTVGLFCLFIYNFTKCDFNTWGDVLLWPYDCHGLASIYAWCILGIPIRLTNPSVWTLWSFP